MNGSNECSSTTTSSSEPTPPDKLAAPGAGHQKLTSSVSAPLQQEFKTDFYPDLQTRDKDSPSKCILNNHKMEERKR